MEDTAMLFNTCPISSRSLRQRAEGTCIVGFWPAVFSSNPMYSLQAAVSNDDLLKFINHPNFLNMFNTVFLLLVMFLELSMSKI